ncbi:MAG: pentapeptide repeat-containing protein [Pirellulales bacterium]
MKLTHVRRCVLWNLKRAFSREPDFGDEFWIHATYDDWARVLADVESVTSLRYRRTYQPWFRSLFRPIKSGLDIPKLGRCEFGNYGSEPTYLVTHPWTWIAPDIVFSRVAVSLTSTKKAVVLRPSGVYGDDCVIMGTVGRVTTHPTACDLYARFQSLIQQRFRKIERCYIGEQAEELMKRGWRLTTDARLPGGHISFPGSRDDEDVVQDAIAPDLKPSERLTYEQSCLFLQRLGYPDVDEDGMTPPIPDHRPQQGDESPLGVSFFRTLVSDVKLENLTLPRTFFGRSRFEDVSFRNTDLTESTMCWNDLQNVDFTGADLTQCDLRSTDFDRATFVRSCLRGADLRHSIFKSCEFANAEMHAVKLTRKQAKKMKLSEEQKQAIDWHTKPGDVPPGG